MREGQTFHFISGGEYSNYAVCLWCGAILKCNLDYRNCLTYANIYHWHMRTLPAVKECPVHTCQAITTDIDSYLTHILNEHGLLIIYSCATCGVGFISLVGVALHTEIISGLCS